MVGDSDGTGLITAWSFAREYVWGPGDGPAGLDELLAQFDGPSGLSKPWWILQDSGGDVVAQCETTAAGFTRVVGQWTYDPYGSVATAETLETSAAVPQPPPPHLGHKGLFLDRLDEDLEGPTGPSNPKPPRLTPSAKLLVQMRNRAYLPDQGRFLQADPNETAMTLVRATAPSGAVLGSEPGRLDLGGRFRDGGNLYAYLSGSGWKGSDPLGLWVNMLADAAGFGAEIVVRSLRGGLENMLEAYGANVEDDLEWAMDWSQPDDWHSRLDNSWVGETFRDGFVAGATETVVDFINPMGIHGWGEGSDEARADASSLVRMGLRAARSVKRLAPAARLALTAAKRLRLGATTSAAEISRVFKRLGYKMRPHFVDRLRGVGPNAHPARMSDLGLHSVDDVLDILRKGRVVPDKEYPDRVYIIYGQAKLVMESKSKMLITVLGEGW